MTNRLILCSLVILTFNYEMLLAQFNVSTAAETAYYQEDYLRFTNHNYLPNVKTVMLYPQGWPLSAPIYDMNNGTPLELHFDVLDSTMGNYMFTLIHCDHDWTESDLDPQEYLTGPAENYLNEYEYSRNTFQRYIHYSIQIPNFDIEITKSGNYILMVYQEGDKEDVVLTRRFSVVESGSGVTVSSNVHQATRVKERYSHQEVDFEIIPGRYSITNPYTDLKVVILQNHTWESAKTDLQPRFVKDNSLDYNYDGENTFYGINEFRLIDIADTRFTGQGVDRVSYTNQENHAYLEQNKSRSAITYLQNPDMNGWFFIKNDRPGTNATVDSDYIKTHFALHTKYPLTNGDVYIFGALTDWQLKPEAKMTYDQTALEYTAELYLKQGLYNYVYVSVKDGVLEPDLTSFEGSHYETENDYTILIYHRPLGLDYDRLIAVEEIKYSNN
jgi:hypothetical protein